MIKQVFNFATIWFLIIGLQSCSKKFSEGPFFATGIKIGEVTQNEAIVWARLTKDSIRIGNEALRPDVKYIDPDTGELVGRQGRKSRTPVVTYPEGYDIDNIEGATPGSEGYIGIKYKVKDAKDWEQLDWEMVKRDQSFAHQFKISGLSPGEKYEILVEARPLKGKRISAVLEGSFRTPSASDIPSDVNFIVTTGTAYGDVDSDEGYKLYPSSLKLDPDFFVHTGDILYYDGMGKTLDLARWHWDRMYSFQNNIDYHRQVASYFIKDDHDTWMNDAYPGLETKFMGEFTYEQGTNLFLEEVPMGEKTYRTIRWGKDLQIWLVEGRDYRSPNVMEDGPGKTIWGAAQMDWFKKSVIASDATYKVLISPTPIVGPDRVGNKSDNHANTAFSYEGDRLRQFISEQKNMVTVCGDRHWQYISKDLETGVVEFSCGPGGNDHAGGWKQDNKLPEHIYLNVVGGFLEGSVSQQDGKPIMIFRHYTPDGDLLNEHVVELED